MDMSMPQRTRLGYIETFCLRDPSYSEACPEHDINMTNSFTPRAHLTPNQAELFGLVGGVFHSSPVEFLMITIGPRNCEATVKVD